MKKHYFFYLFLAAAVAVFVWPQVVFAQATQVVFGKNRVQFHKTEDEWMLYETANFVTYWFGDARPVAQATMQTAELDYADVQNLLEHPLAEKIEVVVYADLTDFKTSNIGNDDESGINDGFGRPYFELAYSGGQLASTETKTRIAGNKMFVYFDGSHARLRTQIREGIAAIMLNSMLFGSSFQEIVQNAVLLNLPPWFTDGLLAYCGEEWNPELDNQLRDILASGKYKTFEKLTRRYPRLAGHAMWHYIGLHFGRQTVSNLLYLTRINRSVDAGFLYVLGGNYKRTSDAALSFFKKRYEEDSKNLAQPDKADALKFKNKRNLPITQVKISPDGKWLALVKNDLGKWRVELIDLEKNKAKTLAKGSSRNALQTTDFNYPLLAWNPNNQEIAILFEQRDILKMTKIDLILNKKKHDKLPPDYQRVYSMSFLNANDLVFSAMVKGYSDLFIYKTITRSSERLTQDFWDDLDATVIFQGEKRGILWASNRTSDTLELPDRLDSILPLGHFDLFFYDLEKRGSELVRVTQTPLADERNPMPLDTTFFSFLSDESGVFNRQAGYLEDFLAFHRQVFFKKNGEEITLEGSWNATSKTMNPIFRAWKKAPNEETGELKTTRLKLDSTFKLPAASQLDSTRLTEVWKKRPFIYNQTNYDRSILEQSVASRAARFSEVVYRNGRYQIFLKNAEPRKAIGARLTKFRQNQFALLGYEAEQKDSTKSKLVAALPEKKGTIDSLKKAETALQKTEIPDGWRFQSKFSEPTKISPLPPQVVENERVGDEKKDDDSPIKPRMTASARGKVFEPVPSQIVRFNPSRIIPYRLKFRTDQLSTTLDNGLLFEGLDSYAGTPGGFHTPPLGVLMKGVFKDLFEDYSFEAGFRVPTTFNGAEYFMLFDNKKRRLDKRIALYRKSTERVAAEIKSNPTHPNFSQPTRTRVNTLLGQYELRWPLDIYTSLRGTATLRQDRSFDLSTDDATLKTKPLVEQRAGLRLAAVFDNTIDIDLNLRTGSRAKIWVEAMKKFNLNPEQREFSFAKGFMTVIGLDARHYQRLDRRSILATRLAGATSFGSERILYFLGGVDEWIFPKFNDLIPLPTGNDFAYQTLAANLRGFKQNIRNGNSYVLINNELRVPVFKYFLTSPTLGNFWRNFQLIGFFDAGTAWQGKNPYSGNNPINTIYLENPPTVQVKVNYFRDPLVAGYGFGVRSTIFGFFIRADYGWGIETRQVQPPILHFALGTDF